MPATASNGGSRAVLIGSLQGGPPVIIASSANNQESYYIIGWTTQQASGLGRVMRECQEPGLYSNPYSNAGDFQ